LQRHPHTVVVVVVAAAAAAVVVVVVVVVVMMMAVGVGQEHKKTYPLKARPGHKDTGVKGTIDVNVIIKDKSKKDKKKSWKTSGTFSSSSYAQERAFRWGTSNLIFLQRFAWTIFLRSDPSAGPSWFQIPLRAVLLKGFNLHPDGTGRRKKHPCSLSPLSPFYFLTKHCLSVLDRNSKTKPRSRRSSPHFSSLGA